MCDIKKIPELIINNDWFTGLIGAYIKSKKFGNVFDGTKTYHIAHNLDPSYEGRLYPNESEGSLGYIHELPDDWLVDPFWKDKCVNPSRCAFMNCSNWGTVSHSYKY